MSEELSYKVSVEGVKDLDALANNIEKVNNVLRAGNGAGKSLEEMRKILVGMKGQSSIIDQLRASVQGLSKSSAGLKTTFVNELTGLKGSLINELRSIQAAITTNGIAAGMSFNDSIADGMRSTTKKVDAEADATVAAIKKAQKQVAAATNKANEAFQAYNPNSGLKGQVFFPRGASATTMTVDDIRNMLGMPNRATMSHFASQLKQQMQEEVAKAQMRGKAATPMNLDDTRAMLGLPDRSGMQTFAAQLKSQMQDELAKSKLRGASATPMSMEDTRAMLGMPSRGEMSSFASQLKSQLQDEMAKAKLRGRSATPMSVEDTRAMLGAPSRAEMSTFASQLKAQMQEEMAKAKLRGASATPMSMEDTRAMLGMPSRGEMSSFASQLKSQLQDEMAKAKLRGRSATPMSVEDTRAMLGAPSRAEMSTFASQLKAQMQDEMAKAKLRSSAATPMGLEETRLMLGLPSRVEMKSLAAQLKAQMQEEVSLAKYREKGSALGMAPGTVGGAFSEFNAVKLNAQAAKAELDKLTGGNGFNRMGADIKRLNMDLGDTHSLARGLASGFDLLWLTWGKLAPLFTGAALSFGVRKTFDIGADVEYNIKMMEMLGQSTAAQAPIIRQALRDIDQTTQFSLLELSKAMVTLGQAGLTTKDSLATLRPAADLASLGMVDLKTSTDLLIQTTKLFGKTTADSGKLAAQIFEATKSGVLNVEDIFGSMKYASEANTRFGKSVEETLALLNALADAGLKGSAGGTAFINFLRDLHGRSGPAVKALKELGDVTGKTIEAFNKDGSRRDAVEMFADIADAAKQLRAQDADKLLGKIFSDRGGRLFYAMVREGKADLTDMVAKLKEVSEVDFFKSARGLMDTSKGALDVLQGTMVGALDTAFEKYSSGFKSAIMDATKFIDSAQFQGTLNSMIGGVMGLYDSLKSLWPMIKLTAEAFVVFKAATAGMAVFQAMAGGVASLGARFMALQGVLATTGGVTTALTTAVSTNGAAMIGQQAAANAAASGQTRLQAAMLGTNAAAAAGTGVLRGFAVVAGFLANPLVGIAVALGLVGATFYTTSKAAQEHSATFTDAVVTNGTINIQQWDKEIAKLQQRNAIMAGGNALSRYSEQMDLIKRKDAEVDKARTDMQRSQKQYQDSMARDPKGMLLPVQSAQVKRDTAAYMKQLAEREKMSNDIKAMAEKEQKDQDEAAAKAAARSKKLMDEAMGNPNAPPITPSGGGRGSKAAYEKYFDAVEARAKNANEYAKAMWQEMYNAGEMSATDYYNNLIEMANREADSVIEAMRRQIAAGKDVEQAQVAIEKAEQDRTLKTVQLNNQRVAALTREEYSLEAVRMRLENMRKEADANAGVDLFGVSHGPQQAERLRELANITKAYDAERARVAQNLAKQVDRKDYEKLAEEAKTAYADISAAEAARRDKAVANWAVMDAATGNWMNGVKRAYEVYATEAANKSDQVASIMGNVFKGMEDMLVNFATTGKASFQDFASSVITSIIRMEAKALSSSIFGLLGGGSGGGGSPLGSLFNSVGSFLFNAKGNVYNSPSLSQYSNGIYNKPTMFAFAKGAGVFGEAGPEAIMPLTRASGGDLGVKMVGGMGGRAPQISIETNVHVSSDGNVTSTTTANGNAGGFGDMARELSNLVSGQIERETRHNGIIWRAINGY